MRKAKPKYFTDTMFPPTLAQVKTYFQAKGMRDLEAVHFFQLYQLRQWRNQKGKLMTNWKNAAIIWIQTAVKG